MRVTCRSGGLAKDNDPHLLKPHIQINCLSTSARGNFLSKFLRKQRPASSPQFAVLLCKSHHIYNCTLFRRYTFSNTQQTQHPERHR
ncbi:ribosome-binding protein [Podospora pseudocomata]|uniref:Ribosome-binding protein n=1 Tax=Podospora pseudocomata TaxID=2093779 RepID=A0ABR0GHK7_9PEZI|nr:ribosome-binding protein [Podospora pseudocomata]